MTWNRGGGSEMKRNVLLTAIAVLVVVVLLAPSCANSTYYTATPPPYTPTSAGLAGAYLEAARAEAERDQAANQATVQAAIAIATLQAIEANAESASAQAAAQAQATAVAVNAAATMQAMSIQATAADMSFRATQTAEAQSVMATANAYNATATAMARSLQATAQADSWTATAEAVQARGTATAAAVEAIHQATLLEREALELERARRVQPVRTWGPWALLALAGVGLALLIWRAAVVLELRGRAVKRDQRGDAPVFLLPLPGGGVAMVDPDRGWGPATVVNGGTVTAPQLAPPEYQERTTARDQAVDLKTRGLPTQRRLTPRRRVPTMLRPGPPPNQGPMARVIRPEQVRPWLEDVEGQLALTAGGEHDD